jgi:hypothetical protein
MDLADGVHPLVGGAELKEEKKREAESKESFWHTNSLLGIEIMVGEFI